MTAACAAITLIRCAQKMLRILVSGVRVFSTKNKRNSRPGGGGCFFGAPAGTRTPDTLLKRQVLYLLSYWGVWLGWRDSNPLYRSQSPVCYHYTTSQYPRRSVRERGRRRPPASFKWGGIWGSNPRHPEPQSGALPAELIPPYRPRKLRIVSLPRQARKLAPSAARPPKNESASPGFVFETGGPSQAADRLAPSASSKALFLGKLGGFSVLPNQSLSALLRHWHAKRDSNPRPTA